MGAFPRSAAPDGSHGAGPPLRDLGVLFAGDALSVLGAYFNLVAVAALTFALSRGVAAMSLQVGAASLAGIVAGPWAGAWADRCADRRRPMLLADLVRAAAALGLAAAHRPWEVAPLAAAAAAGGALYGPARGGLMVRWVGRDALARYNGWRAVIVGASRVAGPLLAGSLLARFGVGTALALNAAGYAASAAATLCVRAGPRIAGPDRNVPRPPPGPRAALAWTARDPVVRQVLAVWGWVLVGTWCVNTLWFVWVQSVRFGGPAVMGAAIAAYEGASVVAGVALMRSRARPRVGTVLLPAVGLALCWCALAMARSAPAVVALSAIEGIGAWWLRLFVPTLIQRRAPDALVGGALAVESQVDSVGRLAGVGLAAAMGPVAAPPGAFLGAAAVAAAGFGATAAAMRVAARLRRPGGAAGGAP